MRTGEVQASERPSGLLPAMRLTVIVILYWAPIGTAKAITINDALLVQSSPVNITSSALPSLTHVALVIRNGQSDPVAIQRPSLLGVRTTSGEADAESFQLNTTECQVELQPGAACRLTLMIDRHIWPGTYFVEVGIGGIAGGWSERTVTVNARFPSILALSVSVLGILAGIFLDEWRGRGRASADAALRLRLLADGLDDLSDDERLQSASAKLRRAMSLALERFQNYSVSETEIAAFTDRADRLRSASSILTALGQLDTQGQKAFELKINHLIEELLELDIDAERHEMIEKATRSFTADIRNWARAKQLLWQSDIFDRYLTEIAYKSELDNLLRAAISKMRDTVRIAANDLRNLPAEQSVESIIERLQTTISVGATRKALDVWLKGPSPSPDLIDPEEFAKFRSRLDDEMTDDATGSDILQGLLSAIKARPGAVMARATVAAQSEDTSFDLRQAVRYIQVNFGFSLSKSLDEIRLTRRRYDFLFNGGVILIGSLALVGTMAGTSTWGTGYDVPTLFLAAVGTRLLIGAAAN